ncbi:MAG TPA: hypothetical protein VFV05_24895 [Methylomirabilota bacterium]|nr:hypothetical protein [Methylomirabilota bacterium]
MLTISELTASRVRALCRTLDWPGFPSTGGEFQAYRSFQTHELDVLLRLSGQETRIKRNHFGPWSAVSAWKVESRHNVDVAHTVDAAAMVQAAGELLEVL